jgi:hypothetical protein
MGLTNPNIPDPRLRLNAALIKVLHQGFPDNLEHVSRLATQRVDARDRVAAHGTEALQTHVKIARRAENNMVDGFACAIHLSELKPRSGVVDENQGCCPICQNSYTDLSTNTAQDLLSDFPVRIKYCGHIVGKGCLEQWMDTPKIDEAKYPHRTCPLCRVKIEGVQVPRVPDGLLRHVTTTDRRAQDTLKEMLYGWDLDVEECLDSILACMSEEIAIEQLRGIITEERSKSGKLFEEEDKMLMQKLEELREEKWVWGFRGDGVWKGLREQWKQSLVAKKKKNVSRWGTEVRAGGIQQIQGAV